MLNKEEVKSLIGKEAPYAYKSLLLSHEGLNSFSLFNYSSPPMLQKRIVMTNYEESIVAQAISLRETARIPFWEAIFSSCLKNGKCTKSLLMGTFFHNSQGNRKVYERNELENGLLQKVTEENMVNVALCSEVIINNISLHFMFIDFHCEINHGNDEIVKNVCLELFPEGFLIFDSGDSYHAASLGIRNAEERIHLLGKALLVSPIVDPIYIAHQLQQSTNSIRISKGGKARQIPRVVESWRS